MADFHVELNGEDINRSIADAITKSVLGEAIVKVVKDTVDGLTRSYDNPVKKVVEQLVREEILRQLGEYQEVIREKVKAQLTDELADKVVAHALNEATKRLF